MDNARVSLSEVAEQIPAFVSKMNAKAETSQSSETYFYKWSQILSLEPTHTEIQKAIEIIHKPKPT